MDKGGTSRGGGGPTIYQAVSVVSGFSLDHIINRDWARDKCKETDHFVAVAITIEFINAELGARDLFDFILSPQRKYPDIGECPEKPTLLIKELESAGEEEEAVKLEDNHRKLVSEWLSNNSKVEAMKESYKRTCRETQEVFLKYLSPTMANKLIGATSHRRFQDALNQLTALVISNPAPKLSALHTILHTIVFDYKKYTITSFVTAITQLVNTENMIRGANMSEEEISFNIYLHTKRAITTVTNAYNPVIQMFDYGGTRDQPFSLDTFVANLLTRELEVKTSLAQKHATRSFTNNNNNGKHNKGGITSSGESHNTTTTTSQKGTASFRCYACNGEGHKRGDKKCPKYDPLWKQRKTQSATKSEAHQTTTSNLEAVMNEMKKEIDSLRKTISDKQVHNVVTEVNDTHYFETTTNKFNDSMESYFDGVDINNDDGDHEINMHSTNNNNTTSTFLNTLRTPMRKNHSETIGTEDKEDNKLPAKTVDSETFDSETFHFRRLPRNIQLKLLNKRKAQVDDQIYKTPSQPTKDIINEEKNEDDSFNPDTNDVVLNLAKAAVLKKKKSKDIPFNTSTRSSKTTDEEEITTQQQPSNSSEEAHNMCATNKANSTHQAAIIDSGASRTMMRNKTSVSNFNAFSTKQQLNNKILLGGQEHLQLLPLGQGDRGIYHNVLIVPELKRDLLSVAELMKNGCQVIFIRNRCFIYKDNQLVGSGTRGPNNLIYEDDKPFGPTLKDLLNAILDSITNQQTFVEAEANLAEEEQYITMGRFGPHALQKATFNKGKRHFLQSMPSSMENAIVLHNRLGHVSVQRIANALKFKTAIGMNASIKELELLKRYTCYGCQLAQFKKLPAPERFGMKANLPFCVIGCDIKGPYRIEGLSKSKYWQVIVCQYSNHCFVQAMRNKADAVPKLIELINEQRALNRKTMVIQSDSDIIYKSQDLKSYALNHGIILEYTAPYRHEGYVERKIQDLEKTLRTTLITSGCPEHFWDYLLTKGVTHTLNCIPNSRTPHKSPYELFYNTTPDVSRFVPLGFPGVVKRYDEEQLPSQRTSLEPQGEPCTILGYATDTPGALIVITRSKRIIVRKDVKVDLNHSIEFKNIDPINGHPDILALEDKTEDSMTTETTSTQHPSAEITIKTNDDSTDQNQLLDEESSRPKRTRKPTQRLIENNMTTHQDDNSNKLDDDEEILGKLPLPPTPNNFSEASKEDNGLKLFWIEATYNEFLEFTTREAFTDKDLPNKLESKPFGSKLVFKVAIRNFDQRPTKFVLLTALTALTKLKENNWRTTKLSAAELDSIAKVLKFKARLVALGYTSIFGIHYHHTYSPTVHFRSLLTVLQLAKMMNWHISNIDIGNAYLEALVNKLLYLKLPNDLVQNTVVRLIRNIYGMKDAGLLWYQLIAKVITTELGYSCSRSDPCVFIAYHTSPEKVQTRSFICLFVDDMAICGEQSLVEEIKIAVSKRFKKITDLGELTQYLGLEMTSSNDDEALFLHQRRLIQTYSNIHVLRQSHDDNNKQEHTNTQHSHVQQKTIKVPLPANNDLDKSDQVMEGSILELTGKLNYIANRSRPDIKYTCSKLSSKAINAPAAYKRAAQDVFAYLESTKSYTLKLGGADKDIQLFGYSDASLTKGTEKGCAQLGGVFFITRDSGSISNFSVRDTTVSNSSTEAEIKALSMTFKEGIWLRELLTELGFPQTQPTIIYIDNKSAITLSEELFNEIKTKHIMDKLSFIRECINKRKLFELRHIDTHKNVADIFTNARDAKDFTKLAIIALQGHSNNAITEQQIK